MTTRNTQRANNGLTCLIAPCCLDREYEIRRLFIAYAETLEEWDEMLKIDPEANPDILSDASQEFVKNECGRIFVMKTIQSILKRLAGTIVWM